MKAKSIKGESPEEIQFSFRQRMADGFTPRLAILFSSIQQHPEAVCSVFTKQGIDIPIATSIKFLTSYKLHLFLFIWPCNDQKLSTPDAWFLTDLSLP